MNALFRVSLSANRKQPEDYAGEVSSLLGARASWEEVAGYAQFLGSLYEAGERSTEGPNARDNYEVITDQIVRQMEIVDGEDLLRSQSVYEKIKHNKYQHTLVGGGRQKGLKEEIKEFAKLERRLFA